MDVDGTLLLDEFGTTELHELARLNDLEGIAVLLQRTAALAGGGEADFETAQRASRRAAMTKDASGCCAMFWAVMHGHIPATKCLLRAMGLWYPGKRAPDPETDELERKAAAAGRSVAGHHLKAVGKLVAMNVAEMSAKLRDLSPEVREELEVTSCKIQRVVRGGQARTHVRWLKARTAAAKDLQRVFRGILGRKRVAGVAADQGKAPPKRTMNKHGELRGGGRRGGRRGGRGGDPEMNGDDEDAELDTLALQALLAPPRLQQTGATDEETGLGWTVLHWAFARGDPRMVPLLLDAGASFEARDALGRTPPDLVVEVLQARAARRKYVEQVEARLAREAAREAEEAEERASEERAGRAWVPAEHGHGPDEQLAQAREAAQEAELAHSTALVGAALVEGGHRRVHDLVKTRMNNMQARRRKAQRLLREAELEAQLRATRDSRKPHLEDEDNVFVLAKAGDVAALRAMLARWVAHGDTVFIKLLPAAPGVVRDAAYSVGVGEDSGINRGDTAGWTPLHCAAQAGHAGVVALLVTPPPKGFGAHLDSRNAVTGETALHVAAAQGHAPVIRFLTSSAARAAGRAGAAAEGAHGHAARELDVNAREAESGETALHMAACRGHVRAAAALIDAGALVCEADRLARQPLHWAAARGFVEMTRLLLIHGASCADKDSKGLTAWAWAEDGGEEQTASLLRRWADPAFEHDAEHDKARKEEVQRRWKLAMKLATTNGIGTRRNVKDELMHKKGHVLKKGHVKV